MARHRLLLIAGTYPPDICGVGDYTAALARGLADLEAVDVHVLTRRHEDHGEYEMSGRVFVHRRVENWGLIAWRPLMQLLKEQHIDTVHIQYPSQGFYGRLAPSFLPLLCRFIGRRVIQTWHEPFSLWRLPMLLLQRFVPGPIIVVRPDYTALLPRLNQWLLAGKSIKYIRSGSSIPRAEHNQAVRDRFPRERQLILFFGFMYPHKGVHHIFDLADSARDYIVLVGPAGSPAYLKQLEARATEPRWKGHADLLGPVGAEEAAQLLAASDAVVLPFEYGGGVWNTSIHAAVLNGAFVVTTSRSRNGYDGNAHIYYAKPGDTKEMAQALSDLFEGHYRQNVNQLMHDHWKVLAREHLELYLERTGPVGDTAEDTPK